MDDANRTEHPSGGNVTGGLRGDGRPYVGGLRRSLSGSSPDILCGRVHMILVTRSARIHAVDELAFFQEGLDDANRLIADGILGLVG